MFDIFPVFRPRIVNAPPRELYAAPSRGLPAQSLAHRKFRRRKKFAGAKTVAFAAALAISPAQAQTTELELVLLADASGSISREELLFQRQSYADAITDPAIIDLIQSSAYGSIAVTYVEWAAFTGQVTPWILIDGPESAQAFADALTGPQAATGRNNIGGALLDAKRLIDLNEHEGWRRVIDFSGDSANTYSGPPIRAARDEVVASGIVINALAISSADRPGLPDLYDRMIVGGPGSFVVTARGREDFAKAVRRKLILEIGGFGPRPNRRLAACASPPCPDARPAPLLRP